MNVVESDRHRTAWLEDGPAGGPLMIFLHGWPERGLMWRAQMTHFAGQGWRCVAPDMRGYGGSSAPAAESAYTQREIVADMVELHDALGGRPAVWVGHDWGSPVVFALAAQHADRCRAVASLCVPYLPDGFALANLLPLVDRALYPAASFPDGQWGYYRFYSVDFDAAVADFEASVPDVVKLMFRPGMGGTAGKPARSALVALNGGWFGPGRRPPEIPGGAPLLSAEEFAETVEGLSRNGFRGPCAWYVNDEDNIAYAGTAPDGGRLDLPVLFVHAAWDAICDTVHSSLADPMREACSSLTEATVDAGHMVMLEQPAAVTEALDTWLSQTVRSTTTG